MEVRRADVLAQSTYLRERKLKNLDDIETLYAKIKEAKQCVSLKELAVSGSDLIAIGIKPGKEIGEILNRLLEMVIEDPELNQKEILLKKLQFKKGQVEVQIGDGVLLKKPRPHLHIFAIVFIG